MFDGYLYGTQIIVSKTWRSSSDSGLRKYWRLDLFPLRQNNYDDMTVDREEWKKKTCCTGTSNSNRG